MAIISSHILDSVTGKSAVGIRVELIRITSESNRQSVFDITSDKEGRIHENVETTEHEYELVFHTGAFFSVDHSPVTRATVRFVMRDNDRRYHMPMMLSPHSHSLWWSE